jgi:hypothetical protein
MKRLAAAAVIGAMLAGTAGCEQTQPIPPYEKMLVLRTNTGEKGPRIASPGSPIKITSGAKKGGG